jgi:Ribbon-helix-helix protein, copG family
MAVLEAASVRRSASSAFVLAAARCRSRPNPRRWTAGLLPACAFPGRLHLDDHGQGHAQMVAASRDGAQNDERPPTNAEGARRTFHRDEPGNDSAESVRDRAVVFLQHPQQRITSLLMQEPKTLIAFRCERSAAEQLAALAQQGDRSLSAEIRRAVREHVEHESPGCVPRRPSPGAPDEHRGPSAAPLPAVARGEDAA